MKISGFTIIKNATVLDFPAKESVMSLLPLVDEMIIVLGRSEDDTEEVIRSMVSEKIKIISTDWDQTEFKTGGMIYAAQTDIALKACSGDWCVYIQADEVLHEDAVPVIREACQTYLHQEKVEGFALPYTHFYGDFDHYIYSQHFAYPWEVRVVRNHPDIHSWKDAQSFRRIPHFDGKNFYQKRGTYKLGVKRLQAPIFHYGWARNPLKMARKRVDMHNVYHKEKMRIESEYHDYGNLSQFPIFKGQHPAVMKDRIEAMNWRPYLRYGGKKETKGKIFGIKYRILAFIEREILGGGRMIAGFKNYKIV